jgi:drug/metabolite transporter (DMT)-like permease
MPPFLLAAARFLIAGGLLYGYLRARGTPAPTVDEWRACAKVGVLLLVVGNVIVLTAGRAVPPSSLALTNATMPLLATLAATLGGRRLQIGEYVGLTLGFVGLALLNRAGLLGGSALALVLLVSPASWVIGSLWSRRIALPSGAMATAAQLIAAGVCMLVLSLLFRERCTSVPSLRSFGALAYLALAGSLVAFTAYGFVVQHAPAAVATSHAYVNPMIAMTIGVVLGGEHVAAPVLLASGTILAGVATLTVVQLRIEARETTPVAIPTRVSVFEAPQVAQRLSLARISLMPPSRPSLPPV